MSFDVVALGEVLIEVATLDPFGHDVPATLGVSGDALNVAAAAAAAGAHVGLIAILTDNELGHAIAARIAALGIATELLRFRNGQQGMYLVHSDCGVSVSSPTRAPAASVRRSDRMISRRT